MTPLKRERWRLARYFVLALLLVAGGATAVHLTTLLQRRADGMTRYVRVDAWAGQQVQYQLEHFRALFARHVAGDPEVTVRAVRDRLAQVRSAVSLLYRGEHYDEFRVLVDIEGAADETVDTVDEIERTLGHRVDFRGDLAVLRSIEELLGPTVERLRILAVDMAHIRLELQDGDLANVRWLTGINRWMLFAFFGVAGAFILVLLGETRTARRAERSATANAERSRYLAEHDQLTGLPNRMVFRDRLQDSLADAKTTGREVALHVLDLDGFKPLNDVFGDEFGDRLLVAVAGRISETLGEGVAVMRLAGDEFAVIESSEAAEVGWASTAHRLLDSLDRPFTVAGRKVHIGTSIGVARFPDDGPDADGLLKAADLALDAAKQERGCFRAFDPDMMTRLRYRRELEEDLREALHGNALDVFIQPQIDLASGRLIGGEALARWNHPSHGWISPGIFVPVAEASGLILPLGRLVLERACTQALQWRGGLAGGVVAVNISPSQFVHEDIVGEVLAVLKRTGLPAERLELEITEGILMRDERTAMQTLNRLHEIGVKLAIDDFGTGYSSLSYLKRFSVDKLKVDQSFVREIDTNREDRMIVRSIVELAGGLGMRTIAEGIETRDQEKVLIELRCQEGQGYLFAKPMPAVELQTFAATWDTAA